MPLRVFSYLQQKECFPSFRIAQEENLIERVLSMQRLTKYRADDSWELPSTYDS